ncbi:damage-inducible protein CinA [Rugosibacter aromaticivorans]|uniref:Damage-inducible protein CinA n=1 Tax=Rugosibacter aromaticivorans TaxID=1565605 RepID=A0A0C5J721_9PROT|nr:nicotinamide-nucleotide amidohydrolase family protein [Rugosibacter aromaticivorans]AJP47449.1 damage-inducible protein CinA [Rugosibacter aromaticivorans]TBR15683.1 MAG: nicotinamide-nucleotide amidohydrolase family protein [Rugosibacter sp.]
MDADLVALSRAIGQAATSYPHSPRIATIATAESCTGGWAAQVITHTAGSSSWFDRGFVTYSNAAKSDVLGVQEHTLITHGAVSEATAREMAIGALTHSAASHALAITGIAGPAGGSAAKPVGTVCFAWCRRGEAASAETRFFSGDREAIRRQAVIHALNGLFTRLVKNPK